MNQTVESSPISKLKAAPRDWQGWLQVSILVTLTGILYFRILANLVLTWWAEPNYSYGFIVPMFCTWVIWKERDRIKREDAEPNAFGLAIIVGALVILVLGILGAEFFLSRTSLLFLLAGLVIQFRGWRSFRVMLFPWTVLFMMIPLPAIVFNRIALPLQFLASQLASGLLASVGVPVLREGNVIHLPSLSLDIIEACSGLRSLASLVTLAVFYGYFREPSVSRRVLLVLSSIPIAVVGNGLRIMGSGLLGEYWSPDKAEGFFHLFSGLLIFVFSLGLLLAFHAVLTWLGRHSEVRDSRCNA